MKSEKPFKIGEGVTLKLDTEAGLHAVAECYDGPPEDNHDDEEPEHRESLLFVSLVEIHDADEDPGTPIDQMEAQYAGFVADIDSPPVEHSVGVNSQLPIDQMSWGNYQPRF